MLYQINIYNKSSASYLYKILFSGYYGDKCQFGAKFLAKPSDVVAIVLPVCFIIIAAVLVLVGLWYWRRKRFVFILCLLYSFLFAGDYRKEFHSTRAFPKLTQGGRGESKLMV